MSVPSAWVRYFAGLIRPGGTVLDLACGNGRHVHWLADRGCAVTGVDRDAEALADEGVLLYETFALGQQEIGRPSRPEFLLAPGELPASFADLRVVAFEDGFERPPAAAAPRFVQRLAVVRLPSAAGCRVRPLKSTAFL